MTAAELLSHLRRLNVSLFVENGELTFQGPEGTLSEDLRRELTARRCELLDLMQIESVGKQMPARSTIPRVSRDKSLLLSFAQRRLWFLDQLEPGSAVYNVPGSLRIRGPLVVDALERSLNEIVARHETLRTTFTMKEEEPVQVIAPSLELSLPVIDIRQLGEKEREDEALRLLSAEAAEPFDLSQGPLLRTRLIRLGDDDHVLLLTLHHIVSDGWSMSVLYRELCALYRAFSNGEPSPLGELPIQYADFAAWQQDRLCGEALEPHLSYWKKQLEGAPEVLNLPSDRPRPARQSYRGGRQSIELSEQLTEGLKTLSRKEGVTLYMTLLAAFQVLLHRYSGQDDIVVGSPIANRNRVELEGLIGFFVNTLVLRADFAGDPRFTELLGKVKETALGAYEHQDLPFEKLVEELRPERDLSRSPLFQALFVFQNTPARDLRLSDLDIKPMRIAGETTKFDLTLSVNEAERGLRIGAQYATDLFEPSTIERMLRHFHRLLGGLVMDPEQRVSALPLLSEAEKQQLLIEWNDTKTGYPTNRCIHELFEAQAEKTPDAVAVLCENQQLTYRELNQRANQLAHYLRNIGVGPESLVGLCMERSVEMIVALLGILKAGGAYVPLDSSYPAERRTFILEDSRASILLTKGGLGDGGIRIDDDDPRSPVLVSGVRSVCLDRDLPVIAKESRDNPDAHAVPDNLAYVIYTSGSTGTPKGVAIEHRQTVSFLFWAQSAFTQDELCGVLASTSICFDLSVFEIFAPLTSGGTVILVRDALALATLPMSSAVTLVNTVPSAMNELLNLNALPQSVRVVNLAGEPLRTDLVRRIYATSSVRKVHDLYGPSECTTYSTWTGRTPDGPQTIGRPIANTQLYILDGHLNAVPVGIVGEIYIGGAGVARGYFNRPELTQEKFIADPFSANLQERLYKTGDLARYFPDGNIEFLGRIDNQVKIRGYRIELGEIEATLCQHPAIQQAVVLAKEDNGGDRRLVAYILAVGAPASAKELRSYLQEKLPEYMVPPAFVFLDALPLTPNGKVDRKALPAPDQSKPELDNAFTAPRNHVEKVIAKIWAEVLKLDRVGIHDNFFDLGGHSLLATRVVSRMRNALRKEIPVQQLFKAPTIGALALLIEKSGEGRSEPQQITRASRDLYRVQSKK